MGRPFENLTGRRFGKLVVRGRVAVWKKSRNTSWLCDCDCGGVAVVYAHHLKRERHPTTSCGCRVSEINGRPNREPRVPKVCGHCGTAFAGTGRQRYCSPVCRRQAGSWAYRRQSQGTLGEQVAVVRIKLEQREGGQRDGESRTPE